MAGIFNKEVEVYLSFATLRGTIATRHARLSDHLLTFDETFTLKNVKSGRGTSSLSAETALVYKRLVILVADLGSDGQDTVDAQLFRVEREPHRVIVGAGPFWVRGDIHIVRGGDLETVGLGTTRFVPLTGATFVGQEGAEPATFIVNREHIGCLLIDPRETV
ncbi:MAG TPA: hypothetical protein VNL14_05165 [Candidatus Acidoferrales bacterium]|nr:hypothetical protein [Candidatus Acidoferrales bacterium]